tara:strand:+ start:191 stop:643 length:453 start_codon:yes stop_codon:yes gene_type:complete
MAEELEQYKDDLELFWDTLDGETDVMDLVGKTLSEISEAEAGMIACNEMAKRYSERRSLLESRKLRLNKMLKTIMVCSTENKIPHPLATVSLRNGMDSVVINNPEAIPTQLCKTTIVPDKAEIKKQLKAGVEIEGAELVTGPSTISIRMK